MSGQGRIDRFLGLVGNGVGGIGVGDVPVVADVRPKQQRLFKAG